MNENFQLSGQVSLKIKRKSVFSVNKRHYTQYVNERKGKMSVHQNPNEMNAKYEFKNINKELVYWLERESLENNCRVEKKEWKSKYNSYVVYDYEPFCSEGFEINVTISSYDINYVNFLKFLFENKVKTIEFLKGCLTA